jgi:ribosomal protein L1
MSSKDYYEWQVFAFEQYQAIKFEVTMRQMGLWDSLQRQVGSRKKMPAPLERTKTASPNQAYSPLIEDELNSGAGFSF